MPTKRRPLQLLPPEDELLRTLYRQENIPTDQYPQRHDDLLRLVSNWNGFTGRNESAPGRSSLHGDQTQEWEMGTPRPHHVRYPCTSAADVFTRRAGAARRHPRRVADPSDNYALNPELAEKLKNEFARRTDRIVPGTILAAAMIYRRKIGNLARTRPAKTSTRSALLTSTRSLSKTRNTLRLEAMTMAKKGGLRPGQTGTELRPVSAGRPPRRQRPRGDHDQGRAVAADDDAGFHLHVG